MYITDVLRLIGENVAHSNLQGGSYISARWFETTKPEDDRSADEIAMDVIKRAGLVIGGETE